MHSAFRLFVASGVAFAFIIGDLRYSPYLPTVVFDPPSKITFLCHTLTSLLCFTTNRGGQSPSEIQKAVVSKI